MNRLEVKMLLDWEPKIRIGPFYFGKSIEKHLQEGYLIFSGYSKDKEWEKYTLLGRDFHLFSCDNILEAVDDSDELIFKGLNLIGSKKDTVFGTIGFVPNVKPEKYFLWDDESGDYEAEVYEDDINDIQMWFKEDVLITVYF